MQWEITMHKNAYTSYDGVKHEASTQVFKCPFELHQVVYYVYEQERIFRSPIWVIRKDRVSSVWATNVFGVRLLDGDYITEDSFDRLFTDKEAALEFCAKKNQHAKVKIYNQYC